MSEIKKINPVEGLNELTKTAGDSLNKAGQAVSETIDMVGETLNSTANTVNETVITPVTDFIQAPHSIDQLLDKLQGSYGMVAYSMFKSEIERAPAISAGVLVAEAIVENTVVSKPVAQIVHKGFEAIKPKALEELLQELLRASLIAQLEKNLPAMQETPIQFLRQEDLPEKG